GMRTSSPFRSSIWSGPCSRRSNSARLISVVVAIALIITRGRKSANQHRNADTMARGFIPERPRAPASGENQMRFVTFERHGSAEAGVISGSDVVGLKAAGFPTLLSVIEGGSDALSRVRAWLANPPAVAVAPMADVRLRAPISRPPKIICIGLNYRDH